MTSQPYLAQPPRIATWLINLFTPAEQEETILGDLLEEFSHFASKSRVAFARRWYWRQTVKTIAHLFYAGFQSAPWLTAAAVAGGFWLHGFVSGLPDKLLKAVTDRYLFYWSAHFQAYMWVLNGMLIAHLILSMFVGCTVALVAKRREMVATVMLALIFCELIGAAAWVCSALHGRIDPAWMLWSCSAPFAIVAGGAIVRTHRSPSPTLSSGA